MENIDQVHEKWHYVHKNSRVLIVLHYYVNMSFLSISIARAVNGANNNLSVAVNDMIKKRDI